MEREGDFLDCSKNDKSRRNLRLFMVELRGIEPLTS